MTFGKNTNYKYKLSQHTLERGSLADLKLIFFCRGFSNVYWLIT